MLQKVEMEFCYDKSETKFVLSVICEIRYFKFKFLFKNTTGIYIYIYVIDVQKTNLLRKYPCL